MLAKQAWSILKSPTSLLARIYKAKYYKKTEFFGASIGSRPSHVWRSILAGRDLLKQGVRWVIGNGQKVNVWTDNWIMNGNGDFHPARGPGSVSHPHLSVSQLIHHQRNTWNYGLMEELITQADRDCILNCRFSLSNQQDFPSWIHTRLGIYTVRSGYNFLLHSRNLTAEDVGTRQVSPPSSGDIVEKPLNHFLWQLNCPPKLKFFLWRCINDALPVLDNLRKRKLGAITSCPRCGEEAETTSHCLFQCRVSQEIWTLAPLPSPSAEFLQINGVTSVLNFFKQTLDHGSASTLFPFLLWQIWKSRNAIIFEGQQWSIPNIVNKSLADYRAWEHSTNAVIASQELVNPEVAVEDSVKKHPIHLQVCTSPSLQSSASGRDRQYTCYVDASWMKVNQCIGVAWILLENNEKVIVWSQGSLAATASPAEAEAQALLFDVTHLSVLNYDNILFLLDSCQVLEQLHMQKDAHSHASVHHPLSMYIADVLQSVASKDFAFQYVSRSSNAKADELAKQARVHMKPCIISWHAL